MVSVLDTRSRADMLATVTARRLLHSDFHGRCAGVRDDVLREDPSVCGRFISSPRPPPRGNTPALTRMGLAQDRRDYSISLPSNPFGIEHKQKLRLQQWGLGSGCPAGGVLGLERVGMVARCVVLHRWLEGYRFQRWCPVHVAMLRSLTRTGLGPFSGSYST